MTSPARRLKPHRFARITLWARTLLAWLALLLFADTTHAKRRYIRQRFRFASLDWIERLVRALAIIRAVELTSLRKRPRPPLRNAAPAGFRRRINRGMHLRAAVGSHFRKALKHHDPRERIQRLLGALADIDAFARRYLAPRGLRRLTKLHAVIPLAPFAETIGFADTPAPRAADTS